MSDGMSADLKARWQQFVAFILEEYRSHRQDPEMNFEHDFARRKVRLRVARAGSEEWVARTLTDAELRSGDLRAIAQALYAATREG